MRVLAVDPGSRRIGLALSDEEGRVALPLETVQRHGFERAVGDVAGRAREHGADEVVVGLPLDTDGGEGPAARRARRFAAALEEELGLPVVMWDERLTTVAAERALSEAGVRGRKKKRVVDQAAATVLLQSYLDSKTGGTWHDPETDADPADAQAAARGAARRRRRGR